MPIRFRCPHCSRLLGIARRKSGTQINCPQCGRPVTVPARDGDDLDDLDELLNPSPPNGTAPPEPARPATAPPGPAAATKPPAPKPPTPRPQRQRTPGDDDPLFEKDVDVMLGIAKPVEKLDLDDEPRSRAKPVSGRDANGPDDGSGKVVLSAQKATLLVIAVVVLLGVAFAAGFLIASSL